MKETNENIIRVKSFDFALLNIELYKQMLNQKEYTLSKQLLPSSVSIGDPYFDLHCKDITKWFEIKFII
jgi:four helix bundle protein